MAVREVLQFPNPLLKQIAAPANSGSHKAAVTSRSLIATMQSYEGCVGLAAPQIGKLERIVVIDVTDHPKATRSNGLLLLINPKIVHSEGSEVGREGCLSIPDLTANVRRATGVVVESATGRIESEGFEARCILHEVDHLDGILFLDRVESLKEDVFRRKH